MERNQPLGTYITPSSATKERFGRKCLDARTIFRQTRVWIQQKFFIGLNLILYGFNLYPPVPLFHPDSSPYGEFWGKWERLSRKKTDEKILPQKCNTEIHTATLLTLHCLWKILLNLLPLVRFKCYIPLVIFVNSVSLILLLKYCF